MGISYVLKAIQDGNKLILTIPDNLSRKVKDLLSLCDKKHGGFLRVDLSPPYSPRSTGKFSQNHKINGSIMQICEETGNDFEDVKMYVKKRALRRGYPCVKDKNGVPKLSLVTGDFLPKSEKYINTIEAGYLIEEIEQLAAEYGIILRE